MFSILSDVAVLAIVANLVHRVVADDGSTLFGYHTGWTLRLSIALSIATLSLFVLAWFRIVPRERGMAIAMSILAIKSIFAIIWRLWSKSERRKVAKTQGDT